ncbi:MAG: hypothetical protein IKV15_02210 [Bacteroidaceae bacterium]|nr:hypothetical protein [Bacteroidaceae bacterium]
MGLIAAIAGGLLGYLLSENVTAESWWYKLCYALFVPLLLIVLVVCLVWIELCNAYQTGVFCAPLIIGCIPFSIVVFIKMKIEEKGNE